MGKGFSRMRKPIVAAVVLVLHAILCWLFMAGTPIPMERHAVKSLEIISIFLEPTRGARREAVAANTGRKRAARVPEKISSAGSQPPAPPEPTDSSNSRPPIDWQAELAREALDSAKTPAAGDFKDFGFPRRQEAPATSPQFAWDYARTHRTQSIPGGGILVNLNDNCVLVFIPLPLVFCKPGHKPANGELFKDMVPQSLGEQAK